MNGKNNTKNGNPQYKHKGKKPMGGPKSQSSAGKSSSRAPEQTFEEVRYLKHLIDDQVPVHLKLLDNQEVSGTLEYYDHSFVRLTRQDAPNLFIYKHEIKYLYED